MKVMLVRYLAVGAAGFVGAILRVAVGMLFGRLNLRFPLGTMFINVSGSFFLGWFLTYARARSISDTTILAIGAGFVGAYTTFSTYMYESAKLAEGGAGIEAVLNIIGSLILGMLAVWAGIKLGAVGAR